MATKPAMKTVTISAITGRYVKPERAVTSPNTTIRMRVPKK